MFDGSNSHGSGKEWLWLCKTWIMTNPSIHEWFDNELSAHALRADNYYKLATGYTANSTDRKSNRLTSSHTSR